MLNCPKCDAPIECTPPCVSPVHCTGCCEWLDVGWDYAEATNNPVVVAACMRSELSCHDTALRR